MTKLPFQDIIYQIPYGNGQYKFQAKPETLLLIQKRLKLSKLSSLSAVIVTEMIGQEKLLSILYTTTAMLIQANFIAELENQQQLGYGNVTRKVQKTIEILCTNEPIGDKQINAVYDAGYEIEIAHNNTLDIGEIIVQELSLAIELHQYHDVTQYHDA